MSVLCVLHVLRVPASEWPAGWRVYLCLKAGLVRSRTLFPGASHDFGWSLIIRVLAYMSVHVCVGADDWN